MKRLGPPPYTCLITRGEATSLNFDSAKTTILETIRQASADGVSMVQIREKSLPASMLVELSSAAVEALAYSRTLVIVNDRADVAIAAGADGVHLPGTSLPVEAVRRIFGRELEIGVSTHSLDEAEAAAGSGAEYIFFGPIFETPGKGAPVGLATLKLVSERLGSFPVIALGGVGESNFRDVIEMGASGIAAIRSLNERESRRLICGTLNAHHERRK